jgi:protein TonB
VPYKNERVYIDTVIYKFPTKLNSASKYVNPEFIGGKQAFVNFAKDNLRYPPLAFENLKSSNSIVSFIIGADSSIKNIDVHRTSDGSSAMEVIRFVNLTSGKWKAGKLNGKNVPVEVLMTVCFRLEKR